MGPLTAEIMKQALTRLDELLDENWKENWKESWKSQNGTPGIQLIVGGGGAMILAHGFPLGTTDIDAIPKGLEIAQLDPFVKKVSQERRIAPDWLNPYFSTFAHTLPPDYGDRLIEVFRGRRIVARALGKEEMLIMKCFAHRQKDVGHAKALIRGGARVKKVETQLDSLQKKGISGAREALDFLDDVLDQLDGQSDGQSDA